MCTVHRPPGSRDDVLAIAGRGGGLGRVSREIYAVFTSTASVAGKYSAHIRPVVGLVVG